MTNSNISDDDITTIVEETEPKKVKKKRTYEQQKERIIAYLKNRWANDEEYRKIQTEKKLERQKIRYNTDEEYRQKILDRGRKQRLDNKNLKIDEMILNLESLISGEVEYEDINVIQRLYNRITAERPEYKMKDFNLGKNIKNDIKIS